MTERFVVSPNLALDEAVNRMRDAGRSVVHLGFGESRVPPPPGLIERMRSGAHRCAYGPVAGDARVRAAVAGYFTRRHIPTGPDQIIVAPGSKPLLFALAAVTAADVLIPAPCWLTYGPQVRLAGRTPLPVPVPPGSGGAPDAGALDEAVRTARRAGQRPGMLVVTLPDNPTGTLAGPDHVRAVADVARRHDLLIVSDEIYRDLLHETDAAFLSPAQVAPERTVVTTGLSKSLALGGWRIGAARTPDTPAGHRLAAQLAGVASEIWSTLAGPMQEVAEYAFAEPAEIRTHLTLSAKLHGRVAAAVRDLLTRAGATAPPTQGGFYVYPDFAPVRAALAARGIVNSATLQSHLLDEHGVAVLGGHHFGDDPGALRFRAATSLLYGTSEAEQATALHAPDPTRVPVVAAALARLDEVFTALCTPAALTGRAR